MAFLCASKRPQTPQSSSSWEKFGSDKISRVGATQRGGEPKCPRSSPSISSLARYLRLGRCTDRCASVGLFSTSRFHHLLSIPVIARQSHNRVRGHVRVAYSRVFHVHAAELRIQTTLEYTQIHEELTHVLSYVTALRSLVSYLCPAFLGCGTSLSATRPKSLALSQEKRSNNSQKMSHMECIKHFWTQGTY